LVGESLKIKLNKKIKLTKKIEKIKIILLTNKNIDMIDLVGLKIILLTNKNIIKIKLKKNNNKIDR